MIGAIGHFVRFLPVRLRRIWRISCHSDLSKTYYPDCERKGRLHILAENLWWLLRYQEVNTNYYMYGFDRKEGVDRKAYLSEGESRKMRNSVRKEFARNNGGYPHEVIANDKFIFGLFCTSAGLPTPTLHALWDGRSLMWLGEAKPRPLESLLDRPMSGVLKDCAGQQGKGVMLFEVIDGKLLLEGRPAVIGDLHRQIKGQWLIQDRIAQHELMNQLYPNSINTVRIVTVVRDHEPELFCANGRVGVGGRTKDNWSIGGITVAVDMEKGCFFGRGMYKPGYGTWATHHPDTRVPFDGFQLPFWSEVKSLVLHAHRLFYGFHSLGWDVALTPNGPVLVEVNQDWLLAFMQAVHGGLRERFYNTLPIHLRGRTRGCDIHPA